VVVLNLPNRIGATVAVRWSSQARAMWGERSILSASGVWIVRTGTWTRAVEATKIGYNLRESDTPTRRVAPDYVIENPETLYDRSELFCTCPGTDDLYPRFRVDYQFVNDEDREVLSSTSGFDYCGSERSWGTVRI
jgi:hypothetical protein